MTKRLLSLQELKKVKLKKKAYNNRNSNKGKYYQGFEVQNSAACQMPTYIDGIPYIDGVPVTKGPNGNFIRILPPASLWDDFKEFIRKFGKHYNDDCNCVMSCIRS